MIDITTGSGSNILVFAGIGSGVRINYKHMYNFDLMCLYGNSESIRAGLFRDNGISFRLDPQLNRIMTRDSSGRLGLQPGISKLIPTIHALVYAIDATRDSGEEDLEVMRQELGVMLESQERFNTPTPVLVLACNTLTRLKVWTIQDLVTGLGLAGLDRPWAVFEVCCDNMRGVEKGLDWTLHHLAKKRREWQYHMKQSQS